jgi:GNAT superfamily N-acetyltransferase
LWPFGWIRILSALKRTPTLQGNGVGLLPEYQGLGASAMMYAELHDTIRARGADYFELVQVMETNTKSLGDMNMLGIHWHKLHRVYRLEVGSAR